MDIKKDELNGYINPAQKGEVCNGCNRTHIIIPDDARQIIDVLYDAGYEAFVVGGCVRDSLLGKEPKDWDITTSAAPEVVKSLFKKTIDTGIQHGTVTVRLNRESYEVTTYRVDGEYKDSRRPESVEFTSNLEEDLLRRDFTINAMAYNDRVGVVDKFKGIEDLQNRVIRCVGNPLERFSEDALRILRAIRFSAQLDFVIDKDGKMVLQPSVNLDNSIYIDFIRDWHLADEGIYYTK